MQINIGIIGLGTVGCGTVEVLRRNAAILRERCGCDLVVTRIATRTPLKERPIEVDASLVTSDVDALLADPDIHIVCELVGGVDPARDYILRAIAAGKSVVTANKELIAKHGAEIDAAAQQAGVDFLFEGSVGGGIPLIAPLRDSLAGNRVQQITGILNGTTNYILTKMTREGLDFADVLAEAQALGYAETDPTADVDGFDTMYKLSILAGIAFDTPINLDDIYREGIRGVSARDIEYATELGFVIKLVAIARQDDNGELELRVHPALLPQTHPLANVNEVFNAVLVEGDAVGDVMFYGRGAGMEPTGSAVVGDVVAIARRLRCGGNVAPEREVVANSTVPLAKFKAAGEIETRFCVRMQAVDRPGMLAQIATVFGEKGVSLDSIVQKKSDGEVAEIFWLTHRTSQRAMARSLNEFNRLDAVREVSSVLRVEGE
ncbi:MAG TPA: homoserine dehydrogenase [Abditibacteriaceae bacterium]|jgi:homoserine dehydrogenase